MGWVTHRGARPSDVLDFYLPAFARFAAEELIRLRQIGDLKFLGVPKEFVFDELLAKLRAQSDVAQQHDFCQGPRPVEICAGEFAAFARFGPLFVMPL